MRRQPLWPPSIEKEYISLFLQLETWKLRGNNGAQKINDKWLKDFICAMVKTCCVSYLNLLWVFLHTKKLTPDFQTPALISTDTWVFFLMHNHTVAQINTQKVYRRTDRRASYMEEVAKSTYRNAHHGTFGWFHQAFDPTSRIDREDAMYDI